MKKTEIVNELDEIRNWIDELNVDEITGDNLESLIDKLVNLVSKCQSSALKKKNRL